MIDDFSIEYSLEDVINWMLQAARAIEYLGAFWMKVNKVIKPSNMLLDKELRKLKLFAYEITTMKNTKDSKNMFNKNVYIAPELIEHRNVEKPDKNFRKNWYSLSDSQFFKNYKEKTDVYSFGISLEHCLTREMPFSSCENDAELEICKNSDFYQSKNKEMSSLIKECTYRNVKARIERFSLVKFLDKYSSNIPQITIYSSEFFRICIQIFNNFFFIELEKENEENSNKFYISPREFTVRFE